jgi:threonine aldolase
MTPPSSAAHLDARWRAALLGCERVLCHVRLMTVRDRLDRLVEEAKAMTDPDTPMDVYGDGVVRRLEQRVIAMLGVPDALFFPSGVMAQQAALRSHARRRGRGVVALHPRSHPLVREMDALSVVSGLQTVPLGEPTRVLTAADVQGSPEDFDVLMLELPLRDAGFILPEWDDLRATVGAARERGAAVHFDGARLWECTRHFGRTLAEIAELADSVYVSFYKSLGGLSGAVLTGDLAFIEEARVWRHRYGGLLFHQFPAVVAAMAGLDHEAPRLPSYVAKAVEVAAVMDRVLSAAAPDARVNPLPPHIQQFQVWMPYPAAVLSAAGLRQAETTGVAVFDKWREPVPGGMAMSEMTIGASAMDWTPEVVEEALGGFLAQFKA